MSDPVPKEHREAMEKFATLERSEATRLLDALESSSPALLIGDVAKTVAEAARIPVPRVRKILLMLASMSRIRAASGLTIREFVGALCDSLKESDNYPNADWEVLTVYLEKALATTAIQVTAKALQVVGEHHRLYCHARILSDLRPVFDDDTLEAKALVITHQLKLAFHEGGNSERTEDVFVAMDRNDLMRLRDVIDRALGKHKELEEMGAKTGLAILAERLR